MKKAKEKVLKVMVNMAENVVKKDGSGWPPPCIGYIYQPKRPKRKSEKTIGF